MSKKQSTAASRAEDAAVFETLSASEHLPVGNPATGDSNQLLTLELSDLLQDSNGEIVLYNDSHLPTLALRSDSEPIESGAIDSHVTAAGDDVSGYRFVAFDNGTKVYYQDSLDLVVLGGGGDVHA